MRVSINHQIHPTIMVTNSLSYIQKHGVKNKNMQRAVRSQTRNLRKRAEAAIKYAAKKSKLKS